ncbi:MAG: methylmalonyl Co-A mutase-associated GTPase MeaB [Candidatus Bathyarchaeota archaeon]|nr:MAG: methylmalonyl Co-A mutase-associated GTPase MeaB [Candidatus Bathyarchaeota archaeon]
MTAVEPLVEGVLKGDKRAIARAITLAEDDVAEAQAIASQIFPHAGKARIIGVTGPSGAGKSTLVEKIVNELRREGKTVGVVAVDPTSPFSGGAFLGDRIRMQNLSTDDGVFIRSMATRNNPGGLARATRDAVRILDASGKDAVIVETVGAGQSEVAIIKVAQTIVVVLAPGLGDEIQAIKAGMMEIGDVFVVNKADRENADQAAMNIQALLSLSEANGSWKPPIVKTVAITGEGITELLKEIDKHQLHISQGEANLRRRRLVEAELMEALKQQIANHVITELKNDGSFDSALEAILARQKDPSTTAEELLQSFLTTKGSKSKSSN